MGGVRSSTRKKCVVFHREARVSPGAAAFLGTVGRSLLRGIGVCEQADNDSR